MNPEEHVDIELIEYYNARRRRTCNRINKKQILHVRNNQHKSVEELVNDLLNIRQTEWERFIVGLQQSRPEVYEAVMDRAPYWDRERKRARLHAFRLVTWELHRLQTQDHQRDDLFSIEL